MNSRSRNNRQGGFTLIEVMISIFILALISVGIYQATTETYKLRDVLLVEGDFYNAIRLSMGILQRDVSMIYSPLLMVTAPRNPMLPPTPQDLQVTTSDQGRTTQYWEGATDATGIRASRFVGTENSISFVSVSHQRIYKDSPESDFAKIKYELKKDEDNTGDPDAQVLIKTESTNAFDDDDRRDKQLGHSYPLLHGVKKLTFTYYRKDKDSIEKSWDTDKEDMKNVFPDIIIVNIEVVGPQKLSFTGEYKFRPEVPLNGLDPST